MQILRFCNRQYYLFFTIFLLILNRNLSYSQITLKQENQNEKNFIVRTKQFNEFLDRFNYKTDLRGNAIDSVFRSRVSREKLINSLFDLKDPRIYPAGKQDTSGYSALKSAFIRDVLNKNLFINKYSADIIAEAKSKIFYNNIPKKINIYLTREIVGKDMIKWVINSVNGEIFDFISTDTGFVRFIPPSSNETDFINLKRALEDKKYLQYYSSKDYKPDYLTVFYYMLNTGSVKFEYVEEVVYHILDIQGWCIIVKEFNRDEMNSGWLISDILKNTRDKTNYLYELK
jgi:hypothetical protein